MLSILYHVLTLGDSGKRLGNMGTTKESNGSFFLISMPHHTTREAAAQMASGAHVFYLPVGTKHHFFELDQTLGLLQKDLRDLVVRMVDGTRGSSLRSGLSHPSLSTPAASRHLSRTTDRHLCVHKGTRISFLAQEETPPLSTTQRHLGQTTSMARKKVG